MQPGKRIIIENQHFLIGLPDGGVQERDYCFWDIAQPYLYNGLIPQTGVGTMCCHLDPLQHCVVRGQTREDSFTITPKDYISASYGFRPVMYPVRPDGHFDPFLLGSMPNGTVLRAYAMTLNDKPVPTAASLPQPFSPRKTIGFTAECMESRYLIPWVVVNGAAISGKVLLSNISWEELRLQGFLEK